ncbi:FHA domain-containing protein [Aquimonas voraii]|uniref:FHA domain-containing protein n=1 Tax=Aquimonas voraii TaxID=265719 RepID=A0A1G6T406_9GAMM|nr:FHA domain-containing protein [Aquimonas voraii]SDD23890.1 hypothetical protein SAMN04488509_101872 [Aquimonas voraii]
MRFTFPNGEHADLELTRGSLSIGSEAGDTVCLPSAGLLPGHARIELQPERRLCALRLAPGALAYLNARPVRSLALLRAGDVLTLNRVRVQILGSIANAPLPPAGQMGDGARPGGPRVVLRGVCGPYFGRSFGFAPSLSIGRSERADLCLDDDGLAPIQVRLHWYGDRCLVQSESNLQPAPFELNGHPLVAGWMLPGDQLRVGTARFVLEAPGLRPGRREDPHTPVRPMRSTEVAQAAVSAAPASSAVAAREAARGFNFLWLIAAAAAIAGALIALFLYAPH